VRASDPEGQWRAGERRRCREAQGRTASATESRRASSAHCTGTASTGKRAKFLRVMPGLAASAKASARQEGKATAKPWRSRAPGIHVFRNGKAKKDGKMAGTSPAMTVIREVRCWRRRLYCETVCTTLLIGRLATAGTF
jgi:hypothetical protein